MGEAVKLALELGASRQAGSTSTARSAACRRSTTFAAATTSAVIPGGNDALVLYGIPSLSPHAIPSYLAMILGIALALMAMRFGLGIETRIECRGDVCITDAGPR